MLGVLAVLSPVLTDKKSGKKPFEYPKAPIPELAPETPEEQQQRIINERIRAKLYFDGVIKAYKDRRAREEKNVD